MYVCMYVRGYVCMYVRRYVRIYVCMYACMYECVCVYTQGFRLKDQICSVLKWPGEWIEVEATSQIEDPVPARLYHSMENAFL